VFDRFLEKEGRDVAVVTVAGVERV